MADDKVLPSDEELNQESEDVAEKSDDDSSSTSDTLEEVSISKTELEELQKKAEAGENYKKVALAAKGKQKEERTVTEEKDDGALKKSDFYKANEKEAIEIATTISANDSEELAEVKADIDENWDKIVEFFPKETSRDTKGSIVEGIYDAHARFRRRHPKKVSEKEATADLSKMTGKGGQTGEEVPKKPGERKILTNSGGMETWV